MTTAYDKVASRRKWQFAPLAGLALALTAGFGVIMAAIILIGSANPLYPPRVQTIPTVGLGELTTNWFTLATPAQRYLPMTLEVEADVSNTDQWGIWVASGGAFHAFYIRTDGYFRTSQPEWQPFAAVRPDVNRLYIYIAAQDWQDPLALFPYLQLPADHQVTFRINDEIAWGGTIAPGLDSWGIIAPAVAEIDWREITIYTSR